MTAKKNTPTEFKSWDAYVDETKGEPFQIPLSDGETVVVESPSGMGIIRFSNAARIGDFEAMLEGIVGDQMDTFRGLLSRPGSHKALENVVYDMMIHFDIAEDIEFVGPSGGKRKERDPRKIQKLLDTGWRPAGEAPART